MKIKPLHSYGHPIAHYKAYLPIFKYVFIFTFLFCLRESAYASLGNSSFTTTNSNDTEIKDIRVKGKV
ncbi:MAG: hypothetical protein AAGC65_00005, partial [Mucilaginibacter sp.]|uniref:hypothetical protein n=1 Tax=Mucilaginibacter sp. TaxID=1882438 RepID=UPI0031A707C0